MTTDRQFEQCIALSKSKGVPFEYDEISRQYYLCDDFDKIYLMENVWPKRNSYEGLNQLSILMPMLSLSSIEKFIEANEPKEVFQNIMDIKKELIMDISASRYFVFEVNKIKHNYSMRAKFINDFIEKQLVEPLRKKAYFEAPPIANKLSETIKRNNEHIEFWQKVKKRNAEDLENIIRAKTGIKNNPDEIPEKSGKI